MNQGTLRILSLCAAASLLVGNAGCAALEGAKLKTPPEFDQRIILKVADDFEMYQAPRSVYDVGDLQNFHSQHTLPIVIEGAFKQMFGEVEVLDKGAQIEFEPPNVPAVFEVKLLDVANDIFIEGAEYYRGELTLAVAMKSPKGHIFWQKAFRGDGYARVDPQYSLQLGPQDALADAMHNAVEDMQDAIIASPEVRIQMKYYREASQALAQSDMSSK